MSVLDWFRDQAEREAGHYVYAEIPVDRQSPAVEQTQLLAEQHYIRVWLSEMFLKDDKRLFRDFVPVVHSSISLQFADKPAQELPYVAGPQNVGLGTTLAGVVSPWPNPRRAATP